jgi:hypothetical protein
MDADAREVRPDVVVLSFIGAALTSCMVDPATGDAFRGTAFLDKYEADARHAAQLFASARVYLVREPIPGGGRGADPDAIPARWRKLTATMPNVAYVDEAAAAVELPGQRFTTTLPCLSTERCPPSGRAVVRSPDGLHLCPVRPSSLECPVFSSGSWRYGTALARRILADYGMS